MQSLFDQNSEVNQSLFGGTVTKNSSKLSDYNQYMNKATTAKTDAKVAKTGPFNTTEWLAPEDKFRKEKAVFFKDTDSSQTIDKNQIKFSEINAEVLKAWKYKDFGQSVKSSTNYATLLKSQKPVSKLQLQKSATMNPSDIIKKGLNNFEKDKALVKSRKGTLSKNVKKENIKSEISYQTKIDETKVFEEHMDKEVQEDKRFLELFNIPSKNLITETIPIDQLIKESIPAGFYPLTEEFKKEKKLQHTSLISSGVEAVTAKYNMLLRQAMFEFFVSTYDDVPESQPLTFEVDDCFEPEFDFDEDKFLEFLQKDSGSTKRNYDYFYVFNMINIDPAKKSALYEIYQEDI